MQKDTVIRKGNRSLAHSAWFVFAFTIIIDQGTALEIYSLLTSKFSQYQTSFHCLLSCTPLFLLGTPHIYIAMPCSE